MTHSYKSENVAEPVAKKTVPTLIIDLCSALDLEKIVYCHWKSNNQLERTSLAETDLDLLVLRPQAGAFTSILIRLGFKQADAPPDKRVPGMLDFYGYDEPTGKLVHVHAHYQLVLGHDTTKNYRLPVEKAFLETTIQNNLFKVPSPAFEYIIFVIRMMLKHATWDSILIRHGRLSISEYAEIEYLEALIAPGEVTELLSTHLHFIPKSVFSDCVQAIEKDCSIWFRIKTGHQLLKVLRPWARQARVAEIGFKVFRRLKWGVQSKIFRQSSKRRLCNGGAMVAVVGGDGAGKSTALEHLYSFLSKHLDVIRLHVGKPAWSRGTTVIRAILKIGRSLGLYNYIDHTIRYNPERQAAIGFPGYPCLIREVCTARDRFLAISKAQRLSTSGVIVLCDRYPVKQIRLMEGPVVADLAEGHSNRPLVRTLISLEEYYYKRIRSADLLIVLRLEPDTAVSRKPEEEPEFVRMRSEEIWQSDWCESDAFVLDSALPISDLHAVLRSKIWSTL